MNDDGTVDHRGALTGEAAHAMDLAADPRRRSVRHVSGRLVWLSMPALGLILVLPVLIVVFAKMEHMPGALLAYVNWVTGSLAVIALARRRAVGAMVPVLFLPYMLVGI